MKQNKYNLITEFICNRFYRVEIFDGRYVVGFLLNYNSGNLILLVNEGICHISRDDVARLYPYNPNKEKFSDEFQALISELLKDEEVVENGTIQ